MLPSTLVVSCSFDNVLQVANGFRTVILIGSTAGLFTAFVLFLFFWSRRAVVATTACLVTSNRRLLSSAARRCPIIIGKLTFHH